MPRFKETPTLENAQETLINNDIRIQNSHNGELLSSKDNLYNINPYLRESHNCYTYFLNLQSKEAMELCKKDFKHHNMCRRAQPGYLSGFPRLNKTNYNCPNIENRTINDNPNIYKLKSGRQKCDPRFYKGAMVVAPGRDYHYYRLNDDGVWTHKPGYKPTTKYDSNHNLILDPQWAARDYGGTLNYKNFCGYYCIPRNKKRKKMSHKVKNPHKRKTRRNYSWNHWNKEKKSMRNYNKIIRGIRTENNTRKILGRRTVDLLKQKKLKPRFKTSF